MANNDTLAEMTKPTNTPSTDNRNKLLRPLFEYMRSNYPGMEEYDEQLESNFYDLMLSLSIKKHDNGSFNDVSFTMQDRDLLHEDDHEGTTNRFVKKKHDSPYARNRVLYNMLRYFQIIPSYVKPTRIVLFNLAFIDLSLLPMKCWRIAPDTMEELLLIVSTYSQTGVFLE